MIILIILIILIRFIKYQIYQIMVGSLGPASFMSYAVHKLLRFRRGSAAGGRGGGEGSRISAFPEHFHTITVHPSFLTGPIWRGCQNVAICNVSGFWFSLLPPGHACLPACRRGQPAAPAPRAGEERIHPFRPPARVPLTPICNVVPLLVDKCFVNLLTLMILIFVNRFSN